MVQIYIGVFIPAIVSSQFIPYLNHFNFFSQLGVTKVLMVISGTVALRLFSLLLRIGQTYNTEAANPFGFAASNIVYILIYRNFGTIVGNEHGIFGSSGMCLVALAVPVGAVVDPHDIPRRTVEVVAVVVKRVATEYCGIDGSHEAVARVDAREGLAFFILEAEGVDVVFGSLVEEFYGRIIQYTLESPVCVFGESTFYYVFPFSDGFLVLI